MGGDGDDTRDDGNADRKPLNMTLAAIIVSVDFDQGSEARISLAAALAVRFNSLLIGVAGWPLQKHHRAAISGSFTSRTWILRACFKRARAPGREIPQNCRGYNRSA